MTATFDIHVAPEHERSFEAMGTTVRLLIGARTRPGLAPPEEIAAELQEEVEDFDRRLSRFRPDSELSAFNSDPRTRVPASPLLIDLVDASLEAAYMTGGLVDPTLLTEIGDAGYVESKRRAPAGTLNSALSARAGHPSRPASPARDPRWALISVDRERGVIERAPGIGIDSGGIGKGLAADLIAARLSGYERYLVDCGGDIRIGGVGSVLAPWRVLVAHPLDGSHHRSIRLARGAVATSGIDGRIWAQEDGFSHHLLDPGTGTPAWTGIVSATALAPSAVEAEARAKAALLSGLPSAARSGEGFGPWLEPHGGLVVTDTGEVLTSNAPTRSGASEEVTTR